VNKFILQKQNQIVDELLFDFLSHISWKLDEEKFFDLLKLIQNQPVLIIVYLSEFDRVLCVCVCVCFCQIFLSFSNSKPKYFQWILKTRSLIIWSQNSIVPPPSQTALKNGGKYETDWSTTKRNPL
jgi:hypothetical protein